MMDMETVLPRTCKECYGSGYTAVSFEQEYEVTECATCNDPDNYLVAADRQDELDMELEDKERLD